MSNSLGTVMDMIRITYSSRFAMKKAKEYWNSTTVTHGEMSESTFDFYYNELLKIVSPDKNDTILDYAGGNGEIAHRFKINGFNISHCEINPEMVNNAKAKYGLTSYTCDQLSSNKYSKIVINNALFYIHPYLLKDFLRQVFDYLDENGKVYITDTPDFSKRKKLYSNIFVLFLTKLFPVYQPTRAGFFVKTSHLNNMAKELNFSISKTDSWTNYRSHWVLSRINAYVH